MERNNDVLSSLINGFSDKELLEKIIEFFPYPIQVHSLDGTTIMMNNACLSQLGIKRREEHVGVYNVFNDPIVMSLGIMDEVKKVLKGKAQCFPDICVAYKDMVKHFGVEDKDVQFINVDISCYPIVHNNEVVCFVAVFIIKRIYRGMEEISKAKEYMEKHWFDKFSVEEVAKAVNLSPYHFSRLFKKHTGITPHSYYMNVKINKLKDKLTDKSLSVSEAFAACGIDYHGHFARVFKQKVGINPAKFRKDNLL